MLDSIQVIIPALDEEETIGGVVSQLQKLGLSRIRVVDNGSSDRTAAVASVAGAEVLTEARRGYGQACWTGYQQLDDDVRWVLFCDADGSDDLTDVKRLMSEAEQGANFVLGNRRASAKDRGAMTPVQQFGNGLATTLMRWGWGHAYGDLGPLRLIRRDLLERIGMQDRGFGWTIEMQVRAVEEAGRIVEIPVGYRQRGGGRSKISGTVRGSVAAGTIILSTLAALGWRRWQSHPLGHYAGGGLLLVGAWWMARQGDFAVAGTVPWFLAAATVMSVGWLIAGRPREIPVWWFWGVAVAARLLVVPMVPGDDVWRYLWEGQIQLAGYSPYLLAPSAAELEALRTPTWSLINHPDATAIYPPVAQLFLRLAAAIGGGVVGLKLWFLVADAVAIWLLARRFGRGATLLYAWNPLLIYVGVGGAHYEPLLLLAAIAGWLAWTRSGQTQSNLLGDFRSGASAWWLGVAAGIKWITAPLLAWCAWSRLRAGEWRSALVLGGVGAVPVLLSLAWFWWDFGAIGPLAPQDFVREARTSEFVPWLIEMVWPDSAYRNGLLIWFFAPVAAWIFFRAKTLEGFAEWFLFALLLFAPSVHAWYFVWLLPWAVATRNAGTIAISVNGFIYFWLWHTLKVHGEWTQSPAEKLLLWGPLIIGFWWSRRRASDL